MIVLCIDTADNEEISVGIRRAGLPPVFLKEAGSRRSQVVLPLIERLLGEQSITLQDLTAIEVNVGPGSFTGLRVGVTIANTLAHSLHLPINGGQPGEPVEPLYK